MGPVFGDVSGGEQKGLRTVPHGKEKAESPPFLKVAVVFLEEFYEEFHRDRERRPVLAVSGTIEADRFGKATNYVAWAFKILSTDCPGARVSLFLNNPSITTS